MADGYRDSKGHFLPHHMKASDAMDRGVGDKYQVSENYKGKPENALGSLKETNPSDFKSRDPGSTNNPYPQTGNKPSMANVDEKYGNANK